MESEKSDLDELGAVLSETGEKMEDCDECDLLEARLKDLEKQLAVLRDVVKVTSTANPRPSSHHGKKQVAWHERVLGTFAGAVAGSETQKLKEEVTALRKATNTLFSQIQDAGAKRAGNNKTNNNTSTEPAAPMARHI